MTGGASIENDRVGLYNAWKFFRARLSRQQGSHRKGLRQSLLPLLVEVAEEVLLGFESKGLHAHVQDSGKLGLWIRRKDAGDVQLSGQPAPTPPRDGEASGDVKAESQPPALAEELPVQPVFREMDGRLRFTANEFVRWMFDEGKRRGVYTMESLAILGYPDDHFAQFLQLIGYTVSGFEEHSLVNEHSRERVAAELERLGLTAEGA